MHHDLCLSNQLTGNLSTVELLLLLQSNGYGTSSWDCLLEHFPLSQKTSGIQGGPHQDLISPSRGVSFSSLAVPRIVFSLVLCDIAAILGSLLRSRAATGLSYT